MRSGGVVVLAPRRDRSARIFEAREPVLVEALLAALAVEAFDECVLHRLARLDEAQAHAAFPSPLVERLAGEFRAVVHDDLLRPAIAGSRAVEDAPYVLAGDRQRDFDRSADARAVVYDVQEPDRPAIHECIAHEIHRPTLVRAFGQALGLPRRRRDPFASFAADLEALLPIDPIRSLVVDLEAFTPQQRVQAEIAEARSLGGELDHAVAEALGFSASREVAPDTAPEPRASAGS